MRDLIPKIIVDEPKKGAALKRKSSTEASKMQIMSRLVLALALGCASAMPSVDKKQVVQPQQARGRIPIPARASRARVPHVPARRARAPHSTSYEYQHAQANAAMHIASC